MTKKKPETLLPPEEVAVDTTPPPKLSIQQRVWDSFKRFFGRIPIKSPFATPEITDDIVNDQVELGRADRALKKLTHGAITIAVLGVVLSFGAPFFAPIYVYQAITPEGKTIHMVPLELPNLTNPAVVSWAANSTTEILSFGFGDIEAKTIQQKKRFTKSGWKAFVKAFMNSKISEVFKNSQMVMTTVPTDTPIITAQGINDDDVYQWKVEVPIITTFAGNNNVAKPSPGIIEMTIVRVRPAENPAGIAIDIWRQIKH